MGAVPWQLVDNFQSVISSEKSAVEGTTPHPHTPHSLVSTSLKKSLTLQQVSYELFCDININTYYWYIVFSSIRQIAVLSKQKEIVNALEVILPTHTHKLHKGTTIFLYYSFLKSIYVDRGVLKLFFLGKFAFTQTYSFPILQVISCTQLIHQQIIHIS